MSAAEIALRVREKLRQLTEERGIESISAARGEGRIPSTRFPALPPRESLSAAVRSAIHTECEEILRGEWHVLRGTQLHVETPPDWHRDYAAGGRCASLASSHKLDHRSLPGTCDPRLVWETSRFIQLVRLSQRAWLERDEELAETVVKWLEGWHESNPLGRGINWTSPMEPGIRLINLVWIDALLVGLVSNIPGYARLLSKLVAGHVWWVWRYHSFGSSANNHLLGELAGLIMAAARWPSSANHGAPIEKLSEMLWREVDRQFAADGGNREEALHYHLFAWEMCWQSVRAALASDVNVPNDVTKRLGLAGEFFAELVMPAEPWDFGDSDDAHITPVYSADSSALAEWQAWFQGRPEGEAIAAWLGQAPVPTETPTEIRQWKLYAESGYAIRRDGALVARLDLSGLGFAPMAAHGHMDALHLSLWLGDKALVIDPGTGAYFSDMSTRNYLTSRFAHNGPAYIDEEGYPARRGPFLWGSCHDKPVVETLTSALLRASVSYGRRSVTRSIEIVDANTIRVQDQFAGVGDFQIFWQFPPTSCMKGKETVTRDSTTMRISTESDHDLKVNVQHGSLNAASHGLCSPSFGKYATGPGLLVEGRSEDRAQVQTLFVIDNR